jgi:uncharacterized protein YdaU (DUF1376 family)
MKNPPSFQFYPQDFISDLNVQSMTDAECGRYIKLLCHCWIEDGLPVKGGSPLVDEWLKQSSTVARCFIEKDGKYRNKRLDEERRKQINWREKSSKGGLHSAENKRHFKGGSTKGQPKANQGSTLPLQSSSSSSIKKDSKKNPISVDVSESPFDIFWAGYPKKVEKTVARKAWNRAVKIANPDDVITAAKTYAEYLAQQGETRYIKNPATFLNDDRWKDWLPESEAQVDAKHAPLRGIQEWLNEREKEKANDRG